MKGLLVAIMSTLSIQQVVAADVGDVFLLQTKSTTLALRRQSGAWNVAYYGEKVRQASDIGALAHDTWGRGHPRAAAYGAFGDAVPGHPMNKYGGLQVTHADGCLTCELRGGKAETVADEPGATHLVLEQKDAAYPFHVVQHFRALEACDVIETWVELRNGEDGAVRLSRMDSFAMGFPMPGATLRLQSAAARWAAEGQLRESEVVRGQAASFGSRSGVRGAWENNASFMLTMGDAATETAGRVFGGALCWSGMWGASVHRSEEDFVEIRMGVDNAAGAYVLDAGRSITLPKFAFTFSASGKGQVSRNIHKWARDWRLPAGHKPRPVLLNSWEGSYFTYTEKTLTDMMDGVAEMGGELFVLDDGWFGIGDYARDDDGKDKWDGRKGLGDWVVNPKKHPNGLGWLCAEAKRRGLSFGVWVEPEMVNTNSAIYAAHPDWTLRERNRAVHVGRGGSQTVLDYTNPAVRENIFGQLDGLYGSIPGLAYVKWDANADFYNMGSTYLDAEHQANLPFDYTTGLYDLLGKLRAKHPALDIQACSSGGGHVDYGFLKYADEVWTSDDTDARERVFIQWGASQFYPACVLGSHVTDVPNHQTHRTTPLKFRFDVAMAGRLGFELHPKNMKPDEIAFAKRCVADYKRIRQTVQHGDLYRLASPYEGSYAALMYVNEPKTEAVVFLWGLTRSRWSDFVAPLRLQGLAPGRTYRLREINRTDGGKAHTSADGRAATGEALAAIGVSARLGGDFDSAVFVLTAE